MKFRRIIPLGILSCITILLPCYSGAQQQPSRLIVKVKSLSSGATAQNILSVLAPSLAQKTHEWKATRLDPIIFSSSKNFTKATPGSLSFIVITFVAGIDLDRAMNDISSDPSVEYVEPDHELRVDFIPNDQKYSEQWGLQRIGMENAWNRTRGAPSVVIGVIDTGVDYVHEDLRTQFWVNTSEDLNHSGKLEPWSSSVTKDGIAGDFDGIDGDGNGFIDDVIGYDFTDQIGYSNAGGGDYDQPDPDPFDDFGHGTSVAGIIGAATNNALGVAGIAPDCKMMALRAFDARGVGLESDVARAIAYCLQEGVSIINMSFGDKTYSRVLRDVIRYAYQSGITMIASAGNSTSDELHYPSAYDETISVAAISENDGLASFSNFGNSIDLAAPGVGNLTTERQNTYSNFNGTSASAPFVTGVAALIRSAHPSLSPEEIRGILVASADDAGQQGWDHFYGAGILSASRALSMNEPTIVRILSPKTNFATGASTLAIIGTAASPLMNGFTLQYGLGKKPTQWFDITTQQNHQAIAETLAVWDISSLRDSMYVLRLSARSDKGITIEDRVTMEIDHSPPRFLGVGFIPTIDEDGYGVSIGFQTDEATLGKVWYRTKGSSEAWRWISAEGTTVNNLFIGNIHSAFLGKKYLQPGNEYEFYFSAVNHAGMEASVNDQGKNFSAAIPAQISSLGFSKKNYNLGVSRIFPLATDFDNNAFREAIVNDLAANNKLRMLEFRASAFTDVTPPNLMDKFPRAIGDANANGKKELLASFVRSGYLFEAPAATGFPQQLIWGDSTSKSFWTCAIADVNNDGRQEIIAITSDTTIGIFTLSATNQIQQIASLVNPTSPPPKGKNVLGSPTVAIGDFNGNGRTEMLFGDDDADFFIYESQGGGNFIATWIAENQFEGGSDLIASGDFDGDGTREIAVGFRTGDDDIIPFWFFGIIKINAQNRSQMLWQQAFAGVERSGQLGVFARIQNSITAGNIDGDNADELVISTFPEMYVIDYQTASKTFSPVWFQPLVNTNAALIADFDQNGVNEIGFSTADSVLFFEKDVAYTGPSVPGGLSVEYLDAKSVRLRWSNSSAVPEYHLYKGSSLADLTLFGKISALTVSDFSLQSGKKYLYAIRSVDSAKTPVQSPMVFSRVVTPHEAPVVDSIHYVQNGQVEMFVSQDMGTTIPSIQSFRLNSIVVPQSVVLLDQRRILLSFASIVDGTYEIITQELRDAEGIPFDPTSQPPFDVVNTVEQLFFILRVEYKPGEITVYFNRAVDPVSAENIANYSFMPGGKIRSAVVDEKDKSSVHLLLAPEQPIGALGKEYTLKVSNLRSADGWDIVRGAGSTAGVILNKETLDDMFVYPNPYRESAGQNIVTFANLTSRATIRVYTASGLFVQEIEEKDGNGGVEWNLAASDGKKVPTGIYIFYVTGKNSIGQEVEAKKGKFAIIR